MKIVNHRLEGEGISIKGSPNRGGPLVADSIILHATFGPDAAAALAQFANPDRKASAHLLIDRDGSITQLLPFNIIAWHAGPSSYQGRDGFNQYSIAIEMVNAGELIQAGVVYVSWFGKEYQQEQVIRATHRNRTTSGYWHRYTEAQIAVVDQVCALLVKEYSIHQILGHEEISPSASLDPGPAFPLDQIRERLLKIQRHADMPDETAPPVRFITEDKVNIRSGPSILHKKIARPLLKGEKVKILEQDGDWCRICVEIEGWVGRQYLGDIQQE